MVLSKRCPDEATLQGAVLANEPSGRKAMSFRMNRMLDVAVSFAIVSLAFTLAGATAALGA